MAIDSTVKRPFDVVIVGGVPLAVRTASFMLDPVQA
jgi:hypothetical protein